MWPPPDFLVAIYHLHPFVFQALQTLSISITLLWQKLNFLWCIFMYPKCCSILTGSIKFPVAQWCKNTSGFNSGKKERNWFYFNVCIDFHVFSFLNVFHIKCWSFKASGMKGCFQNLTHWGQTLQMPHWALGLVSLWKDWCFSDCIGSTQWGHAPVSIKQAQINSMNLQVVPCSFLLSQFRGFYGQWLGHKSYFSGDKVAGCRLGFSNLAQSYKHNPA